MSKKPLSGEKTLLAVGIAAGVAAAAVGAACALVAPRRPDERLAARWAELARYRYAHRGLHGPGAPENSLAAFTRARELGFGVELDVHLTLDGRLAVVHDSELERVCGRAGTVEKLTISELGEYRLLDVDGRPTAESVPTLDEVLRVFELGGSADDPARPVPAPIIVEIKPTDTNYQLLCLRTMDCLDSYDVRYCVESFDPRVVAWLREHRPDVVRGQLAEDFVRRGPAARPLPVRLAGACLVANAAGRPDFVAYRWEDVNHPAVRLTCGLLGAHLVTWTIRSAADLLASEALGAPAIFEGFIPGGAASGIA